MVNVLTTEPIDFLDRIVKYETTLWNAIDRSLASEGAASLATFTALRSLARQGDDARVSGLSTGLGITIGAASKLVDRLERDGLARRRPHPDDRRVSLISLTEAGHATLATATTTAEAALAAALPHGVDITAASDVIDRLQQSLDRFTEAAS